MQGRDDALDARVVRRDSVADQTERCRHPFEQVDADSRILRGVGLHERIGGVDTGGTGTDDRDAKGTSLIGHQGINYLFGERTDIPSLN